MSARGTVIDDEGGTTAVEYGLIVSLIAVAIIVILGPLGNNTADIYEIVADAVLSAAGG